MITATKSLTLKLGIVTLGCLTSLLYINLALGEEIISDLVTVAPPPQVKEDVELLTTPIFKESIKATVLVHPQFGDQSTNIAFYIKCPSVACPDNGTTDSPIYVFSAENLGQGSKPFSEYWAPPDLTDYIAIEYKNYSQQFSCSDKTVTECQNDSHFISLFEFAIVSETTTISPEMLATKNAGPTFLSSSTSSDLEQLSIALSAPFITANLEDGQIVTAMLDNKSSESSVLTLSSTSTSDALVRLSIDLSAPSISSTLDDGQIVTAILDGKSSSDTPATLTEREDDSLVGGFIKDLVDSVIGIFTPDQSTTTPTTLPAPEVSPVEVAPVESETPPLPEPDVPEEVIPPSPSTPVDPPHNDIPPL